MKDGDSRVQYGYDSAHISRRAQHNIVVVENVRYGNKTIAARLVVHPDGKIREQMQNEGIWEAYESITQAIGIIAAGLGAKTFDPTRISGASGDIEHGADLLRRYYSWYELCNKRHLAPLLVKRMVIDGISFGGLEKEYRFIRGEVKKKVWASLGAWRDV